MARKIITIITALFVMLSLFPSGVKAEGSEGFFKRQAAVRSHGTLRLEATDTNATEEERSMEGAAYAVVTDDNQFIFFRSNETYTNNTTGSFVDIKGNHYSGTVFSGIETWESTNHEDVPWFNKRGIKTVEVAAGQMIAPICMQNWFFLRQFAEKIDLDGIDTSNVTDMTALFSMCHSLKEIDISEFDTSNAESLDSMFNDCKSLKSIDVSHFNTSKSSDIANMFRNCENLESIDVSHFDTSNVTHMHSMFENCSKLKSIDIGSFDTSKVINMSSMFLGCKNLTDLDFSGFRTENVFSFHAFLSGCENLKSVDLSGFRTPRLKFAEDMFSQCSGLTEINLSSFNTPELLNIEGMFNGCSNLINLDISNLKTTTNLESMSSMFNGCPKLSSVKLGSEFTKWSDEAYLPEGTWTNRAIGKSLSEKELYNQYPSNAASWAGTWEKGGGTAKVTGVSLNMNNAKLAADGTLQLTAKISPDNAANKNVTWSVNNSIAKVDSNGKVTMGRSYGTAKVTVKTEDGGYTDTCTIQMLFKDVADSGKYYYNPVYWAADREITKGYAAEGTFKPQNDCTREAVVTFLWRLAGKPNPKSMNSPFTDVKDSSKYYYKAVLWAVEQGITKGYADGTFKPNDTCLREHVVTFLYRYAGKPNPGVTKNPFNDVRSSDYYYNAALWANAKGIAKGYSDGPHAGGFGPKLDCLREHVVTFLYRYNNKYPK